jgi:DNA-binding NtrC family response regulator
VRLLAAPTPDRLTGLVGSSPAMRRIQQQLADLGDSSAPVLLQGEVGTGRAMMARALHALGRRRDGPLVAANCSTGPESLLESELFGHERGAFEGAGARRIGRIEEAEGGTLYLEGVDGLSPALQSRVLRIFTEYSIERLGGRRPVPVDVRVVASTDRDLADLVARREFHGDLAARLNKVRIEIPPLRERIDDVVPLALHFAARSAEGYARRIDGIAAGAVRLLEAHRWPGNVLELRNAVDRAVVRARGRWIDAGDLEFDERSLWPVARGQPDAGYAPTRSLADVERDHIRKVLRHTQGAMGQAADILGIHRNTLTRKVERYGLREEFPDGGRD